MCQHRFPTSHPSCRADCPLQCGVQAPIEVNGEDGDAKPDGRSPIATLHTGSCKRRARDGVEAASKPDPMQVASCVCGGVVCVSLLRDVHGVVVRATSSYLPESVTVVEAKLAA